MNATLFFITTKSVTLKYPINYIEFIIMTPLKLYSIVFLLFSTTYIGFAQNKRAPQPPSQNKSDKTINQPAKEIENVVSQKTITQKTIAQKVSKKTVQKKPTKQISNKEDQPSVVTINDKEYFTINNLWFTKVDGKYKKVDKPQEQQTASEDNVEQVAIQETKQILSNEPTIITHIDQKYRVFRGYWFTNNNGKYEKVNAPVGAQLQVLPANMNEEILNGETYYIFEDTRYKKVGDFYEVIAF